MDLPEGTHTVSFVYHVPFFTVSLIITLFSAAIMLAVLVISKLMQNARNKQFAAIENAVPAVENTIPLEESSAPEAAPAVKTPPMDPLRL